MIGHFPDPLPGELMFSVLARFAERMKYPARSRSLLELFGVRHGVPAIELPNKLDQLVSALPPGTTYTSDSLIARNTLLPFYAPFLPERNYKMILSSMKGNGARTTQLRAGIIAGRINPPEFFRTCPVCDEQNIARWGETYWHRLHQIQGVEVCPLHSVLLEPTNICLCGSARKDALISAQSSQRLTVARALDPGNAGHWFLLRVAESAAWLLDKNMSRPGLVEMNSRYRQVLADNDCLSPRGWIRLKRLREKFRECCTADLLKRYNCELRTGSDGGWLARLFRETDQSMAPLRHLMAMAALNISAEEFFSHLQSVSTEERRQTLFPCLNVICSRYSEPAISKFQTKHTNYGVAHIFECPCCGHSSSRPIDGSSIIRVVRFGDPWMQRLKLRWGDDSRSLAKISEELNADARSLTKYAVQLGLGFPRRGPTRKTDRPQLPELKRTPPVLALEQKRKAWRDLREKNAKASISQTHQINSALYTWLYRNDREWLKENSPARRSFVPQNDQVDWNARDEEIAARVISAAIRLKSDPKRRRRVTVRSISVFLGLHPQLRTYQNKLPRTKSALKAHVESTEEFSLFRITRALDSFVTNHTRATRSDILRAAGISGSTAMRIRSVQQAMHDAKESLDHHFDKVGSIGMTDV